MNPVLAIYGAYLECTGFDGVRSHSEHMQCGGHTDILPLCQLLPLIDLYTRTMRTGPVPSARVNSAICPNERT